MSTTVKQQKGVRKQLCNLWFRDCVCLVGRRQISNRGRLGSRCLAAGAGAGAWRPELVGGWIAINEQPAQTTLMHTHIPFARPQGGPPRRPCLWDEQPSTTNQRPQTANHYNHKQPTNKTQQPQTTRPHRLTTASPQTHTYTNAKSNPQEAVHRAQLFLSRIVRCAAVVVYPLRSTAVEVALEMQIR